MKALDLLFRLGKPLPGSAPRFFNLRVRLCFSLIGWRGLCWRPWRGVRSRHSSIAPMWPFALLRFVAQCFDIPRDLQLRDHNTEPCWLRKSRSVKGEPKASNINPNAFSRGEGDPPQPGPPQSLYGHAEENADNGEEDEGGEVR